MEIFFRIGTMHVAMNACYFFRLFLVFCTFRFYVLIINDYNGGEEVG